MAAHTSQFRVYYEDTDAGGIVYHARYLGFAERGRAEALRSLGMEVGALAQQEGIGFVVRRLEAHYHAPLRLDDVLSVETILLKNTGVRLVLAQKIYNLSRDHQHAVSLTVELGCLDMERMSPVRIPPHYYDCLSALQENVSP
ncbi:MULTISPECIES: YbgC/FadM family acyl-CoA thioesterase [unclassified Saccharibacter]|uniref:YbgC/FadM family acyl-CoA thioesterase n=1 Tax=unclassified Saccharibacter TaxID=2648722 RepID=UPI0013246E50|nr:MULTISPECIES: YbgC/FadM family acyl-CoA thioesterase [unclassified Saccharibacter]MXV35210.1 YbgC/FadM family acyl-CoA thioesterase [Saccharibacter sp. EH611]MXV57243.1 YbgC/FadM family acyl-CoA thioesterase [Saccharibacter sp. EH70]MXV64896.1 YbgC/FadM family acyl-CoA thioesterase [Saccharibacter sp. EH60]